MVFSSITFLVYFLPLLLLLYQVIGKEYKNALLLVASIFFYSWGAPKFIFVILGTTFLDFFLVRLMDESLNHRGRKALLVLSVSMNLGLLFYFKYCNFFIVNANEALSALNIKQLSLLKVVLPIGISFYTFESLTYVVDVYRKVHKPLKKFWDYQLYIILFPKLIAGPIIRYHEIADQIADRSAQDTIDNKLLGFFRFTMGLAKKVFVANTMAVYADEAFATAPELLNASGAWLGMLSYTFQIYFDFSGYSDMAIGLAKMFGFNFPENFENPYTSQSISEFWRRWHISLGKWMKNYLYIPLGGNRIGSRRIYFNLCLVFLASGFWHGASWTFITWGMYHGFFLILDRLFLLRFLRWFGKVPATIITFLLVSFGWVLFRADTIEKAALFYSKLASFDFGSRPYLIDSQFIFYFCLALFFSFFTSANLGLSIQQNVYFSHRSLKANFTYTLISFLLFSLALASLTSSEFNPFIYFRF